MGETNSEVERAISALTAELLKLTTLEGEAKVARGATLEGALSLLALAIMGQSNQILEKSLEEALPVDTGA